METRTMHTQRGMSVTTDLSNSEALALLGGIRNSTFAADLLRKANHGLSHDQWAWVHKLALEARASTAAPTPAPERAQVTLDGIVALFDAARAHLKHPKVRLEANGDRVVFSVAGARSRTPGAIFVTDGEFQGRLYCRIDTDGSIFEYRACTPEVLALVHRFSADPAGVASEYGRLLGACCFCGLKLSDERSTAVGYGKVCAGHYGMPYPQ